MAGYISQIFNDHSLYGDFLTTLPGYAWDLVTDDAVTFLYTKPDAGTARVRYFLYEEYVNRIGQGEIHARTNFLPAKYLELGVRYVIGVVSTAGLCLTAVPLGFAIKVIHQAGRDYW